MKVLAIIPARGGSKRVPHKNIKNFLGKSIISYSIEAALQSSLFDEVMVSTDDIEIANIAVNHGAAVPFMRSAETASDHATTMDALLEVLENYKKRGIEYTHACCIYPTAPLISIENLQTGFHKMMDQGFHTVMTVSEFSYPIHRALNLNEDGTMNLINIENINARSQDFPKAYHDAGQFYWFDVEKVKDAKSLFTQNTGSIILPESRVQDIDTEEDWIMAELKYKHINQLHEYEDSYTSRRA